MKFENNVTVTDPEDSTTDDRLVLNRAGFVKPDGDGRISEYYIAPEVFLREVCEGFDYESVAKMLRDKGFLKVDNERKQIQIRTPEGRVRVYAVKSEILES